MKIQFIIFSLLMFAYQYETISIGQNLFPIDNHVSVDILQDDQFSEAIEKFRSILENNDDLKDFTDFKWTLKYSAYDRCEGSTDGTLENIKHTQIDELIKIDVLNDGEGWACDKREPKKYVMDFSLKKLTSTWSEFVVSESDYAKRYATVRGKGASDYIKVYFTKINGNYLISRLEYFSEDPG